MAVHVHHHLSGLSTSDLCNPGGNIVGEGLYLLQNNQGNAFGNWDGEGYVAAGNNGLFLSEPQSHLSCAASRPRKRAAPEPSPQPAAMGFPQKDIIAPRLCYYLAAGEIPSNSSSSFQQQNQLLRSSGTSTSGRPELVSHLSQHNAEMDAILRHQSDRLHSGLRGLWKRQCVELIVGVERRAAKRLREKEEELKSARARISELEERLRQAFADVQTWFGLAKNNEAVAASLQSNLEDVLLRNAAAAAAAAQVEEGYGDNEQDAQSCCAPDAPGVAEEEISGTRRGACRACSAAAACVLLLPCRHFCLCSHCASMADTCPVCHSEKTTFLEVIIAA